MYHARELAKLRWWQIFGIWFHVSGIRFYIKRDEREAVKDKPPHLRLVKPDE